nr:methyl-CpG-binding domain-containing protein 2-like [Ipomoea batatas]
MQPGEHSVATSSSAKAEKVYPSILGYSFQCSKCSKWRLVPTKEIYENIRANISANPFFCEMANQWERNISCEDPTDVAPDGSRLWAIDKPNIPLPPPGWRRELGFRAVGDDDEDDIEVQGSNAGSAPNANSNS